MVESILEYIRQIYHKRFSILSARGNVINLVIITRNFSEGGVFREIQRCESIAMTFNFLQFGVF